MISLGRATAYDVSTHSRPKAAGIANGAGRCDAKVSTHSLPKAAGTYPRTDMNALPVSTHSRPKAAGTKQS